MAGFRNILGHEQVIAAMQNAIMLGKVSHAYILNGEAGSGKKILAEAFAMTLQCEKGAKEPCMECRSCKQALTKNQPDIIYIHHEKPNTISVEDIRKQVNDDVAIKPYSSPYKIYIIDEAEKMNTAAQNALLKTIEEPPAYVVLLLLTANADSFLPTIRSRCITLEIHPVRDEDVQKYLIEVLKVPQEKAAICTAFAQGNVGKAARLSGSEDFNEIKEGAVELLKRLHEIDIYELVAAVKQITKYKLEIEDYFDLFLVWYRDVLLYKATKEVNQLTFRDEFYDIKKQADISSYEGINEMIQALEKAKKRMEANVNLELVLELMLLTVKEN
ncbi:MAG: DNA polymerase III subunit delta' [Lachnospiraceae bacterium]